MIGEVLVASAGQRDDDAHATVPTRPRGLRSSAVSESAVSSAIKILRP
jgi:hypothetical protein